MNNMSIRNNMIKGAVTLGMLFNMSVGLIGALSLIVYNNMSTRTDKVEAKTDKIEIRMEVQETKINDIAVVNARIDERLKNIEGALGIQKK